MAGVVHADRVALAEGRQRSAAHWSGAHAADVLGSQLVQSGRRSQAQRERLKAIAPHAEDFTNKRAYRNAPLSDADKETNRCKSSIRAKVEHPFLILKRLWGFAKVCYRGFRRMPTAPMPCWQQSTLSSMADR